MVANYFKPPASRPALGAIDTNHTSERGSAADGAAAGPKKMTGFKYNRKMGASLHAEAESKVEAPRLEAVDANEMAVPTVGGGPARAP